MTRLRSPYYSIVLHLALAALAILVVMLAAQNRQLRGQVDAEIPQLRAGDVVEGVAAVGLDGAAETLAWSGGARDRVLLVFTTTCGACKANQGAWRSVYEQLGDQVEVVGVSLDDVAATTAYREAHDLPFRVIVPADRDRFSTAYKISMVPTTVHVGSDGRVRSAWSGRLSKARLAELRADTMGAVSHG